MYLTDEILEKLNSGKQKANGLASDTPAPVTLPDIMVRSFAQVKELAGDSLSWGEKNFLYQQAQKALKENKMAESRILSRANPQLANAVRLGIRPSPMQGNYSLPFPDRATTFVKPGDVSSMFSPAGYLTELYREARDLHSSTSEYHLDTRRPDLASLSLSQDNMDDELSTLSLSNELLLNNIETQEDKDYDGVMEMLSTYRQTGATPFHWPYEATRQAIMLQDPGFDAFRKNPAVAAKMDTASLLGIAADISPELHEILTEAITEDNAEDLIKKNFGEINVEAFQNPSYLARYYGLTNDELASLLGMVSAGSDVKPGVQYYKNDSLVSLISDDKGMLSAVLIQRTAGGNAYQFGYAELVPTGVGTYFFDFTIVYNASAGSMKVGTDGYGSDDIYSSDYYNVQSGVPIQFPVSLTAEQAGKIVNIGVTRKGGGYYANVNFDIKTYPFSVLLLKLNKLIRLYKATGISPSDIRTVLESDNNDLTITDATLSQLFWVRYYMQTYGIDVDAALVLAGAGISQISHGNESSAFTRLFNTPPLNNQQFSADGTALSLKPGASGDTFRLGVLKRALQVNDTELSTLWALTGTKFTATIDKLSAIYRTCLLAAVHGLSITELNLLLSVSPYADRKLGTLTGAELSTLVSFIAQYTQWLKDQNWTVSELYLMLTSRFSTTLSPDIESLITTLKNGLASQDLSKATEAELITAAAPFIAAATQLDSAGTGEAILQWLDQLKPQALTVQDFLSLVDNDQRSDDETSKLVAFCQVMGQLALIVRRTGLSGMELSWLVAHPLIMVEKATALGHDIATLRDMTALHALLARCGTYASEILISLSGDASSEKNNLAVSTVATALTLDEQALTQALSQCSSDEFFYSWIHLRNALQWLDVAATFNITPADVAKLVALNYTDPKTLPAYADWVAVSHALQAGLNTQQTAQLQATLDEVTSSAVCAYVIKNSTPSQVANRDELYSWLLIDNQVSAQVKTTRIAEAIASVQLYVNRALAGQEEGVDNAVKAGKFFSTDWDTYNKRYSTWAGVSELVYYPENYIDPTIRIDQTNMMSQFLQQLSQSQLDKDTVETGLNSYLTEFDAVANLNTIQGYHDSANINEGKTWLIGRDQGEHPGYYWRSVDHSKFQNGKFVANAWSEWKSISFSLNPVYGLLRPVLWSSRLYLVWVEKREMRSEDGEAVENKFYLNAAYNTYDDSWRTLKIAEVTDFIKSGDNWSFYCAAYDFSDELMVAFYQRESQRSSYTADSLKCLIVDNDASSSIMADDEVKHCFDEISQHLELTGDTYFCNEITSGFISKTDIIESSKNEKFEVDTYFESVSIQETPQGKVMATVSPRIDIHFLDSFTEGDKILFNRFATDGGKFFFSSNPTMVSLWGDNSRIDSVLFVLNEKSLYVYFLIYSEMFDASLLTKASCNSTIPGFSGEVVARQRVDNDRYIIEVNASLIDPRTMWENADLRIILGNEQGGYFFQIGLGSKLELATFDPSLVDISFESPEDIKYKTTASDSCIERPSFDINSMSYFFSPVTLDLTENFKDGANKCQVILLAQAKDRLESLASRKISLDITRVLQDDDTLKDIVSLHTSANKAQYIQVGAYRTRLNTLFAKQLISRASSGINAIMTMATQKLPEPKLGEGNYVEITFSAYDESLHGEGWYNLYLVGATKNEDSDQTRSAYLCASGNVASQGTAVTIFLPFNSDKVAEKNTAYIGVEYSDFPLNKSVSVLQKFDYNPTTNAFSAANNAGKTRGLESRVLANQSEFMDFSGANALYFWEMFYYVPMMVFKRLLSENRFTEATQWLHYIWNPAGYVVSGDAQNYTWNVRPLEEETTWHADPLDSVDPDAVAQADPLHYKVATFMSYLDLLIARGDLAYRQLERDTLNEAKMWYVQALNILGDEPYLAQGTGWTSPRLTDAADKTTQKTVQQALLAVRQQVQAGDELHTANSLTNLFLPQQNEKLAGYWQTLNQRLYNLRHNLSIDGQPLSLSVYAQPADPSALLSAAVMASQGGGDLPAAVMPLYRFPVMLESARGLVGQLTQFGSTLLSITERQDAEALSELLQTQGSALVLQSVALQDKEIAALDADKAALEESRSGAQSRLDSYTTLYDEDVNTGEKQAMDLFLSSSVIADGGQVFHTTAGALDLAPNIFGLADGGSRWGAAFNALGSIADLSASATRTAADRISQSEAYRRRRQEWEIQRNAAQSDVKQIDAQLASLAVRREAAVLQKTWLETQQAQTQAQMAFLQNKFSNKALYNWLRGKLAAIYYQFYDLAVSRCLMAQEAYKWSLGTTSATFIRLGAWQGTYAGLMAGETLTLNLAQMEQEYLKKDEREKEVTRTVCLSEFYAGLSDDKAFTLPDQVVTLVTNGEGSAGDDDNGLKMVDKQLQATLRLADLNISDDYPADLGLGNTRRIKQISVTLPALVGPYQDVRAALSYGGSVVLPQGCNALAVSHGMNDSGQFQLDFNDSRWLPFEGIPVDDGGTLTLAFPQADGSQKDLLLSLTDIIVHIRYTIAS